jgi:CheY-like chemotaxis protein/HPt (histidine-containing phosphotransfer) domain-containing protein
VKFTSAGGVRTHVSRAKDDVNAIVFAIEDDGPGIAPEQQGRIFEPFRQADRTTSHVFRGTGLGLSISRQLARKMGGELAVCSTPGRGATFWLTLPLPPTQAPASHSTANVIPDAAPRALRVLLADDDATNRLVGRQLLARLGHTVELAVDGAEALEKVLERRHDLVVMDIEMPNLDGLEATRRLRAAKITIPVLGFTAHVDAAHIAACRTAGMNGVVHKPMDLERLTQAIAHVLSAAPAPVEIPALVEVPPPVEPATPSIDLAALRERVGGDEALFDEVLAAIVVETRRLTADLAEAVVAADMTRLRRTAHTLRGCLANVGAKDLVARLAVLEEAAASADAPRATSLVSSITPRCVDAQHALEGAVRADRRAA